MDFEDFISKDVLKRVPCICCLEHSGKYVRLSTCSHMEFIEPVEIPVGSNIPDTLCLKCHALIGKIYKFKLQVRNSFNVLSKEAASVQNPKNTATNLEISKIVHLDIPETTVSCDDQENNQENLRRNKNIHTAMQIINTKSKSIEDILPYKHLAGLTVALVNQAGLIPLVTPPVLPDPKNDNNQTLELPVKIKEEPNKCKSAKNYKEYGFPTVVTNVPENLLSRNINDNFTEHDSDMITTLLPEQNINITNVNDCSGKVLPAQIKHESETDTAESETEESENEEYNIIKEEIDIHEEKLEFPFNNNQVSNNTISENEKNNASQNTLFKKEINKASENILSGKESNNAYENTLSKGQINNDSENTLSKKGINNDSENTLSKEEINNACENTVSNKEINNDSKNTLSMKEINNDSENTLSKNDSVTTELPAENKLQSDSVASTSIAMLPDKNICDKEPTKEKKCIYNIGDGAGTRKRKLPMKKFNRIKLSKKCLLKEREEMLNSREFLKFEYRCDMCIVGFYFKDNLYDHVKRKHGKLPNNSYVRCDICNQLVCDKDVKCHEDRHYSRLECTLCKKRFVIYDDAYHHYSKCYNARKLEAKRRIYRNIRDMLQRKWNSTKATDNTSSPETSTSYGIKPESSLKNVTEI